MTQLLELIATIRRRLEAREYASEAMVSHGIVTPIVAALGWDCADPTQFVPEFPLPGGRVDFALLGLGRKPAIFVEVKAVGRATDGDRQLFHYAFHNGVPLCVLTDGREWSFYLPSGHGTYEDRRLYRLQLDDRTPEECAAVFERYMARPRVRDGSAFEDAHREHRNAAGRREAASALPRAWQELVQQADELLIEHLSDKAEALCGFAPGAADTLEFLRQLKSSVTTIMPSPPSSTSSVQPQDLGESRLTYTVFGERRSATSAVRATVDILATIAARDPSKLPDLAAAVRTPMRNHIARSPAEVYPKRPDLARAEEFCSGWLIGLNISNREKMKIIRAAASVYGLTLPGDIDIEMPNA